MEVIFMWVILGLCIAAVLAGIRQIWKIRREHAAAAAAIERRRMEWMLEFEQVRVTSRAPLHSEKARRAGFRVSKW